MMTIPDKDNIKDVENAINDYIRDDLGIKDITLDLQFVIWRLQHNCKHAIGIR